MLLLEVNIEQLECAIQLFFSLHILLVFLLLLAYQSVNDSFVHRLHGRVLDDRRRDIVPLHAPDEQLAEGIVVWLLRKMQIPCIVKVLRKLFRQVLAEDVRHLLELRQLYIVVQVLL